MRTRRIIVIALLLLAAVAVFAADALPERSVIVKETQVRDKPSYAGKILGKLVYTDRVQVLELPAGSSWAKVRLAAKKLEGWVHLSALAKDEKPVVKAGTTDVAAGASGSEVALAGKGFNPEVEAEYKKDPTLNYAAVDEMEEYVVAAGGAVRVHHAGRADRGRGCAMKTLTRCVLGLLLSSRSTSCGSFGARRPGLGGLRSRAKRIVAPAGERGRQESPGGVHARAGVLHRPGGGRHDPRRHRYPPYNDAKAREYVNLLGLSLAYCSTMPETFGGWHFLVLDSRGDQRLRRAVGVRPRQPRAAALREERGRGRGDPRARDRPRGAEARHQGHQRGPQDRGAAMSIAKARRSLVAGSSTVQKLTAAFGDVINDIIEDPRQQGLLPRARVPGRRGRGRDPARTPGYDPRALVRMLEVMQTKWKKDGPGFMKTHPSPEERIKELEKVLAAAPAPAAPTAAAAAGPEGPLPGGAGEDLTVPDANGGDADRVAPVDGASCLGSSSGLAAAAVALALWLPGALEDIEYRTWDWRVRLFARPGPATDDIALILLDQQSLDWGKKENGLSWPWPREMYAIVTDFCRRAGAKSLAFDVLYTEPSVYGVEDDASLGQAMAEYGRVGRRGVPRRRGRLARRVAGRRSPIRASPSRGSRSGSPRSARG